MDNPVHSNGDTFCPFPRSVARAKWTNVRQWAILTPRQCEMMSLMILGYQNKEIAREMGVSVNTIKHYSTEMYDRLNVQNRTEAVYRINQMGGV